MAKYGFPKDNTMGVGIMHCIMPHCAGASQQQLPHLPAQHPQNPQAGHNHHPVHHPAHQQSPLSPSAHLNHHPLTVNINHIAHHQQHQQQSQQQTQHQQLPPQYRVITANARSDFHVPGQNYGAQPGGQVGAGGGSVGVSGGRGPPPPPLGSIQTLGQSGTGIPPGGPGAGGQAPSQAAAPGVQSQPPQGPAPTTTPPVHTQPQDMGKQAHLQTQPPSLSQVYVHAPNRPTNQNAFFMATTQGYYPGPRPQQPRQSISHRGGQGGSGTPVVGMAGVGAGGGQPTPIYPHPAGLTVQASAMYMQSQVPGLHTPHQQSVYPINSQLPIQYPGPPQRHQTHQSQPYYQYQPPPIITPPSVFGYPHAPTPQHSYFYTAPTNTMGLTRANASAVSSGAQHVASPLASAQGAPVVPQGTLQQTSQQAQPLPPMGIPLSQTDIYATQNGGATNTANNSRMRKPRGLNAIMDIVNPLTGKNISDEIYKDNETTQSGESSNRATPQPQNNGAEVIADFAARVAKAATEESDSGSTVSASTSETAANTQQTTPQTLSIVQTNSNNDANSQCNTGPPTTTQNIVGAVVSAINSQSLGTCSNKAQVDSSTTKTDSKPLQLPVKEFQPRSEVKNLTIEESSIVVPPVVAVAIKDSVLASTTTTATATGTVAATATAAAAATIMTAAVAETQSETAGSSPSSSTETARNTNASSNVTQTHTATPHWSVTNITQELSKPSAIIPSANPVPVREQFPNLSAKTSSSSPPRRKPQNYAHNQPNATELPSSAKEQKERKTREKSLGSRGAAVATSTTTSVHNQADYHHQRTNGDAVGEKSEGEVLPRNEIQQKLLDGNKAMQKQKSKNKLKPRELNRKGAEKEGTDMDAFVNTAPLQTKTEIKQDNKEQSIPTSKDSNKEPAREISKDIKEKDNYESKKEKEIISVHTGKSEKHIPVVEVPKESAPPPVQLPSIVDKLPINKETLKETLPKIGDSSKTQDNACNTQPKPVIVVPNDVVDHAKVKEETSLEVLIAQKNEENAKVLALRVSSEEDSGAAALVVSEKKQEIEMKDPSVEVKPKQPMLKYTYKEGQWSPLNILGKKVYDRDFLMKLQDDPNSKLKPPNLPELDVVLKECNATKMLRSSTEMRPYKEPNMTRHDSLLPLFAKANANQRLPTTARKSGGKLNKPKPPNVIHVSLSLNNDVKLRKTENAWKPSRLKDSSVDIEDVKTEELYKKVRSVLNKLTPQKFDTLIKQVRVLPINTQERLQGVINLVFEKAVDEPSFSVAYALMCKELGMMEVTESDNQESSSVSFKKLIITRCQKEFEKNLIDDVAKARKVKEIEECTDPEKKKELQLALEDEERRIRIKSVGNIRFIGELYKQLILTTKIMHRCIKHLLEQNDEDSLECLCKLLTTIGKDLEAKGPPEEMQEYFHRMREIVARKGQGYPKISSRIRFMIQDVIELRVNNWVPRRDESNPKTIDQIQKEAESERLDSQLHNVPLNTPRKDDRNNDRKRNRGVLGPTDDGWSQPVGRMRPATYSVETAKLKNKPPPMDDMQLGNRTTYVWTKNPPISSSNKTISANKFACLENMSNLDQDKRIPTLPLSGSRSTGPRECGRDYKSSYGMSSYMSGHDSRSSRNGSHQLGSVSSGRESSLGNSHSQSVSMSSPVLKSASQPGTINHKPPMSEQEFMKASNSTLKHYLEECIVENTALEVKQTFDNATFGKFTRECINYVLEKSPSERKKVSELLSHLMKKNILPIQCFKSGLGEVLEIVDDLVIDIPKIWTYLAEIISLSIEDEAIPLLEMKSIFISLRSQGFVGKLVGELLTKVLRKKGPTWVADMWNQGGLQLSNLIDPEQENVDKIIKEYNLEFLTGDYNSNRSHDYGDTADKADKGDKSNHGDRCNNDNVSANISVTDQLTLQQIYDHLKRLMKVNTKCDEICNWITVNVGNRVKDPKFVRNLVTAILETSLEENHGTWKLKHDTFTDLQMLIHRYADANDLLELQCLYAIQSYMTKLEYPSGVLVSIINRLWTDNVISSEAFLTWQNSKDPAEREGHAVAMVALTSFFTDLQEPDDNSSVEELSSKLDPDLC